MRRKLIILAISLVMGLWVGANGAMAQTTADPQLVAAIAKIQAIDHHAHPQRLLNPGEKSDEDWDALPPDVYESSLTEVRLRPDNPEFIQAWKDLYGYPYNDMSEAHLRELHELKARIMKEQGDNYPNWVLARLGIETMFANRVQMGRGLTPPHFGWVAFVDALIFPLNNESILRVHPKYRKMYEAEGRLLRKYVAACHQSALPPTLNDYLNDVVTPTIERMKQEGAVALKFEAAYLRPLDFGYASKLQAARVYGKYVKSGVPSIADYKILQDFLFRYIARQGGRLKLAIHFHVGAGGGGQYELSGASPLLLDSLFSDPTLDKTNFVIIHGGWPWTKATAYLIGKNNVYADFSSEDTLLYPRALSHVIRDWLEWFPEHVMFGTDAFDETPDVGWEEVAWLSTTTARQALALALTGMMNDGEITRARALQLAHMALHDNAAKLYGLQ